MLRWNGESSIMAKEKAAIVADGGPIQVRSQQLQRLACEQRRKHSS